MTTIIIFRAISRKCSKRLHNGITIFKVCACVCMLVFCICVHVSACVCVSMCLCYAQLLQSSAHRVWVSCLNSVVKLVDWDECKRSSISSLKFDTRGVTPPTRRGFGREREQEGEREKLCFLWETLEVQLDSQIVVRFLLSLITFSITPVLWSCQFAS